MYRRGSSIYQYVPPQEVVSKKYRSGAERLKVQAQQLHTRPISDMATVIPTNLVPPETFIENPFNFGRGEEFRSSCVGVKKF